MGKAARRGRAVWLRLLGERQAGSLPAGCAGASFAEVTSHCLRALHAVFFQCLRKARRKFLCAACLQGRSSVLFPSVLTRLSSTSTYLLIYSLQTDPVPAVIVTRASLQQHHPHQAWFSRCHCPGTPRECRDATAWGSSRCRRQRPWSCLICK